uniref:Uncharacterized protein n=1 Tax=Steinernema glaseri TaxID=37863 RepID=A0A1I7ZWC3_9BILA
MDLRICLLPLLVLLLSPCLASEAHGNDDLSFEYAEDIVAKTEGPPSKIAERFMKEHEKCAQNDWACQPHCNRKFVRPTERHCRIPHRDDNCFGIPIRYNYTFAEGGIDRFPAEYEVLKRFPRCWSSLAPLICAAVYRPCSVRSYYMAGFDEKPLALISHRTCVTHLGPDNWATLLHVRVSMGIRAKCLRRTSSLATSARRMTHGAENEHWSEIGDNRHRGYGSRAKKEVDRERADYMRGAQDLWCLGYGGGESDVTSGHYRILWPLTLFTAVS